MKKNIILIFFILLTFSEGFAFAALGVVLMGYTVLIQMILKDFLIYKTIKKRLPGSESTKEKLMRWLIADSLEFSAIVVIYLFKINT
jgi:hypothetical protein